MRASSDEDVPLPNCSCFHFYMYCQILEMFPPLNPLFCVIPVPGRGRGRHGSRFQSPAGSQPKAGGRGVRSELKTKEQILKLRKKKQKHQFLQSGGLKNLRAKSKKWLGEVKQSGFGRGGQKKGKMRKRL